MTDEASTVSELSDPPSPYQAVRDIGVAPVIFVNQVIGAGFLNGVINLTLGTAQFTPDNAGKIELDIVISSRLRMDLHCARAIRDQLDQILASNTKASKAN